MSAWDDLLERLQVISDREEDRYSDIPGFGEDVVELRDTSVKLDLGDRKVWFPLSQLRKAEDDQSIYASKWILEQKGL